MRTSPSSAILGCALLVLGWAMPLEAADRALLIGIDQYQHPQVMPTPGGATDAHSVARTIEQAFGFSADSIRVLTDEQATARAIVDSFQEWLIDGTLPGDRVFFLYAGHGSQLADQNDDEEDGFDETLAPFDTNPLTGENQIRDDVIDALIAQLSGRRSVLLFDSCHSGTLTRSGGSGVAPSAGARLLPRPDQMARLIQRRGSGERGGYRLEALEGGEQTAFDTPASVAKMSGVVAISAAGPGQLAYPLVIDGRHRGALSYLFEEAINGSSRGLFGDLQRIGAQSLKSTVNKTTNAAVMGGLSSDLAQASVTDLGQGMTVATLESMIDKGMERLQSSGHLPGDQQPWFEVLSEEPIEELPLYGGWQQATATALTHPTDTRSVTLRVAEDQKVFHSGDHLELEVETDHPGYLYVMVFSEQNQASCIFPNPLDRDHWVDRGAKRIPTHDRYRIPVREPYGQDMVVALVADQKLQLCERIDYTWDEILAVVELDEVHANLRRQAKRRGFGFEEVPPPAPAERVSGQTVSPSSGTTSSDPPSWQTAALMVQTREETTP